MIIVLINNKKMGIRSNKEDNYEFISDKVLLFNSITQVIEDSRYLYIVSYEEPIL
jgi:hypothetical protein